MKKILALLSVCVFVLVFVSCSNANNQSEHPKPAAGSKSEAVSGETASVAEEPAAVMPPNPLDLATALLADPQKAKSNAQYVYSDSSGTTNLGLVDAFIKAASSGVKASLTGIIAGGTVPVMYELVNQPDGALTLTSYSRVGGNEALTVDTSTVTDIYEAALFYQFSNAKENLYHSIPKVSLVDKVVMDDYQKDSDQKAPITAAQAKAAAEKVYPLVDGYFTYLRENKLGNASNKFGVVIPENLSFPLTDISNLVVVTDGAAQILGEPYYQVSFYINEEFSPESYYVDATNAENIFLVSMVDGSLTPLSYQETAWFSLPNKTGN